MIEPAEANEEEPFFLFLGAYFSDPDDDELEFSLDSPAGFSLLLDTMSGVLAGIPTAKDAALIQPIQLAITAVDGKGGSTMQTLQLLVLNGTCFLFLFSSCADFTVTFSSIASQRRQQAK